MSNNFNNNSSFSNNITAPGNQINSLAANFSNMSVVNNYAGLASGLNALGAENPVNQKNINNEIISKSIVYGSIAFWLGKKSEQNLTHKWCVYVRGNNNEDISYFVKEVVFTLHSTFENNVRVVKNWPYELYASGWGEFDIKITIHLLDETIKPIEFIHFLKLYPPANQTPSTKKPIVSEFFDEIVFVNPKKFLRDCLLMSSSQVKKQSSFQIPLNSAHEEDRKADADLQGEENKFNISEVISDNGHNDNYTIVQSDKSPAINQNNFSAETNLNVNASNNIEEMDIEATEANQVNAQQSLNNFNDSISVFSNNNLNVL